MVPNCANGTNRAKHHNYNAIVFYFAFLSVLALFIRGNPELNKDRKILNHVITSHYFIEIPRAFLFHDLSKL